MEKNLTTTLEKELSNWVADIEKIIKSYGNSDKYIKSQQFIQKLHSFIVINAENIPFFVNNFNIHREVTLSGDIKQKSQDICLIPKKIPESIEDIECGELRSLNYKDKYGHKLTEKMISINVRSQLSSLMKNKDTLFERTYAEALNLHMRCPKMVLGEVYLIPVFEIDGKNIKNNTLEFLKPNKKTVVEISNILNEQKILEIKINKIKSIISHPRKNKHVSNIDPVDQKKMYFYKKTFENNIILLEKLEEELKTINDTEQLKIKKNEKKILLHELQNTKNMLLKIYFQLNEKKKKNIKILRDIKKDKKLVLDIQDRLHRYINFFTYLNNRNDTDSDFHKYERCTLIIVDISDIKNPKIYNDTAQLKSDGLVSNQFNTELSEIGFEQFLKDLSTIYEKRFENPTNSK